MECVINNESGSQSYNYFTLLFLLLLQLLSDFV